MSFPAASKHVRVLEQARLVRRRVVGRTHLCTLAAKPLGQANDWLEKFRQFWEESFERLDDLLEELKTDEKETPPTPPKRRQLMKDAGTLKVTTPTDREIVLTRVFDAPRQMV